MECFSSSLRGVLKYAEHFTLQSNSSKTISVKLTSGENAGQVIRYRTLYSGLDITLLLDQIALTMFWVKQVLVTCLCFMVETTYAVTIYRSLTKTQWFEPKFKFGFIRPKYSSTGLRLITYISFWSFQ